MQLWCCLSTAEACYLDTIDALDPRALQQFRYRTKNGHSSFKISGKTSRGCYRGLPLRRDPLCKGNHPNGRWKSKGPSGQTSNPTPMQIPRTRRQDRTHRAAMDHLVWGQRTQEQPQLSHLSPAFVSATQILQERINSRIHLHQWMHQEAKSQLRLTQLQEATLETKVRKLPRGLKLMVKKLRVRVMRRCTWNMQQPEPTWKLLPRRLRSH